MNMEIYMTNCYQKPEPTILTGVVDLGITFVGGSQS